MDNIIIMWKIIMQKKIYLKNKLRLFIKKNKNLVIYFKKIINQIFKNRYIF